MKHPSGVTSRTFMINNKHLRKGAIVVVALLVIISIINSFFIRHSSTPQPTEDPLRNQSSQDPVKRPRNRSSQDPLGQSRHQSSQIPPKRPRNRSSRVPLTQSRIQSSQSSMLLKGSAGVCRRTPVSNDAHDRKLCRLMFDGEVDQNRKTAVTWRRSTLTKYVKCASDCDRFRSKHGYWTSVDHLSDEEMKFPLAFSILMYEQFEQFERLLRLIYRPHNFYCIHVDRNAPPSMHLAAKSVASCLPKNVVVANPSLRISWGTISILDAELRCIEQLLALNSSWKYFINLVGRDFPLRTNLELVRILKTLRGANDIDGSSNGHSYEYRITHVWKYGEQTDELKDSVPHNLTLSKGNTHIAARREFVDFALNDRRAQDFLHWLRDTQIPDETFFNSLNRNPQLNIPGEKEPELLCREKRWDYDGLPCHGEWIRQVCSVSIGDLPWVISSKKMFINKIRLELDPVAFRCLELWYADRVRSELSGAAVNGSDLLDLRFYKRQDYVKHHV